MLLAFEFQVAQKWFQLVCPLQKPSSDQDSKAGVARVHPEVGVALEQEVVDWVLQGPGGLVLVVLA